MEVMQTYCREVVECYGCLCLYVIIVDPHAGLKSMTKN